MEKPKPLETVRNYLDIARGLGQVAFNYVFGNIDYNPDVKDPLATDYERIATPEELSIFDQDN